MTPWLPPRRAAAPLLLAAALAACAERADSPLAPAPTPRADVTAAAVTGTIVLAGGGAEGDVGDTSSWSYKLYKEVVENGDVDGDGVVRVAVLTVDASTTFITDYFEWIGTTLGVPVDATIYQVTTRAEANDPARVGAVANADAVFLKGGDQGVYYDQWNGTLLEAHVRTVVETRGGAVGGTSAGAMSQSQFCLCGSADLVSADVMTNSHTSYLNDVSDGGTGIHTDFLSFLGGAVVDTHFTERGRFGRLLGTMAKAAEDNAAPGILGVGIERQTGLAIRGGVAEVIGNGDVSFVQQTPATARIRTPGKPLVYTHLRVDRLTHGWTYDLGARLPGTAAPGVLAVSYAGDGAANSGALSIAGATERDNSKFEKVATYSSKDYSLANTSASVFARSGVGFTDAGNSSNRGFKQETLFRALYDVPAYSGFLLFSGGTAARVAASPDVLSFAGAGTIVVDGKTVASRGLSPYKSYQATSKGTLRAAALTNLTVHVLAESATTGKRYNTRTHSVVP
jgi:cyanophycinase